MCEDPQAPWPASSSGFEHLGNPEPAVPGGAPVPPLKMMVVRNTFLDVVDAAPPALKHSRSDSDISSTSSSLLNDAKSGKDQSVTSSTKSQLANEAATVFLSRVLPSIGSANHFQDKCQPCSFFRKGRCLLDYKCSHCHFHHDVQARPGKKARDREKARREKAEALADIVKAGDGSAAPGQLGPSSDGQGIARWDFAGQNDRMTWALGMQDFAAQHESAAATGQLTGFPKPFPFADRQSKGGIPSSQWQVR